MNMSAFESFKLMPKSWTSESLESQSLNFLRCVHPISVVAEKDNGQWPSIYSITVNFFSVDVF